MPFPFGEQFQERSKFDVPQRMYVEEEWPDEWKKIHYKQYPRCERLLLPEPSFLTTPLSELFLTRKSVRSFDLQDRLTLEQISTLLFHAAGIIAVAPEEGVAQRRTHPSAGARYPLEIYAAVFRSLGFKEGIYHYDVRRHAIELLAPASRLARISDALAYPWSRDATSVFFASAVSSRTTTKYGERGYRYALLESGHVMQNLSLAANAMGRCVVSLGGAAERPIESLLELDGVSESIVYSVAIGKQRGNGDPIVIHSRI